MAGDLRLYLVSYDVTSPRRWRRIYKTLERCGAWQQLSAFVCRMSPPAFAALERDLLDLMDVDSDRLMIADLGPVAGAEDRLRRHGPAEPLPEPRFWIF